MTEFIKQFQTKAAMQSKWRRLCQGAHQRGKYIEYKFSMWTYDTTNLVIRGTSNYWSRSSMSDFFTHNFKLN